MKRAAAGFTSVICPAPSRTTTPSASAATRPTTRSRSDRASSSDAATRLAITFRSVPSSASSAGPVSGAVLERSPAASARAVVASRLAGRLMSAPSARPTPASSAITPTPTMMALSRACCTVGGTACTACAATMVPTSTGPADAPRA